MKTTGRRNAFRTYQAYRHRTTSRTGYQGPPVHAVDEDCPFSRSRPLPLRRPHPHPHRPRHSTPVPHSAADGDGVGGDVGGDDCEAERGHHSSFGKWHAGRQPWERMKLR